MSEPVRRCAGRFRQRTGVERAATGGGSTAPGGGRGHRAAAAAAAPAVAAAVGTGTLQRRAGGPAGRGGRARESAGGAGAGTPLGGVLTGGTKSATSVRPILCDTASTAVAVRAGAASRPGTGHC